MQKHLHPGSDSSRVAQTSTRGPCPAARRPDLRARRPRSPPVPRPGLGLHSCIPLTSRLQSPPPLAGSGLLQPAGRARAPDGGSRRTGRVPGGAGGVGTPGDPGRGGGPGPGPGVGSGTGAFSLFRCLKLAPAER